MAFINSPNMTLPVPVVGTEPGPQYATDVNSCLAIVDQHNHSAGSGVQITPAGLNINTALTFNGNFATALAGATLQAQSVTPANGTVYSNASGFLFYTDLNTGNPIQITNTAGIVGTPGSISGLVSPASASYVVANKTFVWQSAGSTAANLDAASVLLRNITPNSTNALTLQPPAALGSNYSITLPTLPGSTNIMSMTSAGVMSANVTVDGTTIEMPGQVLQVTPGGIGTAQLAANAVATANIQNNAVTRSKLASNAYSRSASSGTFATSSSVPTPVTNLSVSNTFQGTPVMLMVVPDGNGSLPSYLTVNNGSTQANISIVRDGSVIVATTSTQYPGVNNSKTPLFMVAIDTPGAGVHTYSVNASWSVGSGTIQVLQYTLVAYEI